MKRLLMFLILLTAPALAGELGSVGLAGGTIDSLDNHYHTIKLHGNHTELCIAMPNIEDCKVAIGRWKPDELERVKALSTFCYQQCEHDEYGFVKSSESGQEYPILVTIDFDGSSVSRGVEFFLYPAATTTYKY